MKNIKFDKDFSNKKAREGVLNELGSQKITCVNCKKSKGASSFYLKTTYPKGKKYKYASLNTFCKSCHDTLKTKRDKKSIFLTRLKIVKHYTNGKMNCKCCGVIGFWFMAIDHINGGGNKERKLYTVKKYYEKIVNDGFPKKYQVLCFNCNWTKYNRTECVHKLYKNGLNDEEIFESFSKKSFYSP